MSNLLLYKHIKILENYLKDNFIVNVKNTHVECQYKHNFKNNIDFRIYHYCLVKSNVILQYLNSVCIIDNYEDKLLNENKAFIFNIFESIDSFIIKFYHKEKHLSKEEVLKIIYNGKR